jgi:alpha-beta hydrolase superfamily lysophospholipase
MVKLDLLSIDALKSQLTAFSPSVNSKKTCDSLQAYLDFYNLPMSSDHLSLCTGTISVNQQSVFVCAWQPPNPCGTALLVHGYLDHLGLYSHIIKFLLSRNLTVVCFDLPGHGLSAGRPAYIEDFTDYTDVLSSMVDLCKDHYPQPLHGLGQSTGGAILIKHLMDMPQLNYPFTSLNLFAPLLHPRIWRLNRHLLPLMKPFRKSLKRRFGPSSCDGEFLRFIREQDFFQPETMPLTWFAAMNRWATDFERCASNDFPVNIIQGDADKTLDWKYNVNVFRQKLPNMNLHMIQSANHHMVNESEALRTEIFDCIRL